MGYLTQDNATEEKETEVAGASARREQKELTTGEKEICSTMFTAALFIIARSWKEPRCPLIEEWIHKMWHIYTMEYYSAIKNNVFMKF